MAGLEGLLTGRVLGGRYLIEEVIGRGGMGAVYRAVDERLGRRVAVKVITLSGGDAEAAERLRARFHREARAAAALPHHPNVVPVYDYGTDEALGLDFIVMELLRGDDLATRLARSDPPPLGTALRILLQAARGLAVGHRAGLIHRDVKPGNIFLAESDQREIQVRVVDFGIAKLASDDDSSNQLTQDGRVPHSPAFASPEQLRGSSHLTPASDVFSLGAVGFLLLTGGRPFSEADRNRISLGMPVEAPSLRATQPALPASIEEVVRKALSFDPADRYADAGTMYAALDQALRTLSDQVVEPYDPGRQIPIVAPATPPPPQLDEETRISGTVPADAGAPGDVADSTQLLSPDDRTQLMDVGDRTVVAPAPSPLDAATTAAGRNPSDPRASAVQPSSPRALRHSRRIARERNPTAMALWITAALTLGGIGVWALLDGNPEPVTAVDPIPPPPDSMPELSAEISVEPVRAPTGMDAYVLNEDGMRWFDRGQYDSALVYFRSAVEIVPDNGAYRRNLGLTLWRLGQNAEAAQHLRRSTALDPSKPITHADLANALLALGDTAGAVASLERFVTASAGDRLMVMYRNAAVQKIRDIRLAQGAEEASVPDPVVPEPTPEDSSAEPVTPVVPTGGF